MWQVIGALGSPMFTVTLPLQSTSLLSLHCAQNSMITTSALCKLCEVDPIAVFQLITLRKCRSGSVSMDHRRAANLLAKSESGFAHSKYWSIREDNRKPLTAFLQSSPRSTICNRKNQKEASTRPFPGRAGSSGYGVNKHRRNAKRLFGVEGMKCKESKKMRC